MKALAVMILVASATPTQSVVPDRGPLHTGDCRDDAGVDRCDPKEQQRVVALYGLKPIEEHLAAGDSVRRAFFVDGYGRDLVSVSFVRAGGHDPVLSVQSPVEGGENRAPALTAFVPAPVWRDLMERSAYFDRSVSPAPSEPNADPGAIVICVHSWVYTVEAADAPEPGETRRSVRRKTQDACDDGLAEAYANELAKAAVAMLPPCAVLDPSKHRNIPTLLSACTTLRGDRLAAAEVMNAIDVLYDVRHASDATQLRQVFKLDATLDWQGTSHAASEAPLVWATKVTEGGRTHLYQDSFEGISASRVRFIGYLSRLSPTADEAHQMARVEQIWIKEDERFFIERTTVGHWEDER